MYDQPKRRGEILLGEKLQYPTSKFMMYYWIAAEVCPYYLVQCILKLLEYCYSILELAENFNPLPTNDAHMHHGISVSHKNLCGGFNTRRYTSVHGFCLC